MRTQDPDITSDQGITLDDASTAGQERPPVAAAEAAGTDDAIVVRRPSRRKRVTRLAIVVVLLGAVAAAWWLLTRDGSSAAPEAAATRQSFGEALVTDLIEVDEFDGTLGFTDGEPITSRFAGTLTSTTAEGATVSFGDTLYTVDGEPVVLFEGPVPAWRALGLEDEGESFVNRSNGTITSVTAEGATVSENDVIYEVDNSAVAVLSGDIPAWRTMNTRSDGLDVLQLETALVRLGYDPDETLAVDEDFTSNTRDMVERWQEDIGAEVDGVVDLGEVFFLTDEFIVGEVLVESGDQIRDGDAVFLTDATSSIDGIDVAQLEINLAALGFDAGGSLVVDDLFDAATDRAVRDWQEAVGAEVDGVIDLGTVVFWPVTVRITDQLVAVGQPVNAGAAILATSSNKSFVTVDLAAADQDVMSEGDGVTIELPNRVYTAGTVTSVASVATGGPDGDATFEVIIELEDPSVAAEFDQAPVDVEVVVDSRRGVLAVPVTSLVALREGGYAVEVERDGAVVLVAVEPGFYADGLVEITAGNLVAGDRVVVP